MILRGLLALTLSLILFGCGRSSDEETKSGKSYRRYIPLTLAESKIFITPTVYYVPEINTEANCSSGKVALKNENSEVIAEVCREAYDNCLMQGTCILKSAGQRQLINFHKKVGSKYFFKKVNEDKCPFGYGSGKNVCLDPYYTVAADPNLYDVGDVVIVPDLRGVKLPTGEIHEGYFIVRDTGASIRGHGRFDFFIGTDRPVGSHPFLEAGLGDKNTHLRYEVIKKPFAEKYLKERQFPSVKVK